MRTSDISRSLLPVVGAGLIAFSLVACSASVAGGQPSDPPASPAPVQTPLPSEAPASEAPATPAPVTPEPGTPEPATPAPGSPEPDDPQPTDGGSDAMPLNVVLETVDGHDVYVDIVDRTGRLDGAVSGTPGDGMSVDANDIVVENIDARTLRLTWVDFGIDNALALYIDESEDGFHLVLIQPEPTEATDAMGFDRQLVLTFDESISADDVEAILQRGGDTPA